MGQGIDIVDEGGKVTHEAEMPKRIQLDQKLIQEIAGMADYVTANGVAYPPELLVRATKLVSDSRDGPREDLWLEEVAAVHSKLSEIVPISPRNLVGNHYRTKRKRLLGRMWLCTGVSLLTFLGFTMFDIAERPQLFDVSFLYREGWEQLIVASLYISAAAIGASFYNLFTIYRYLIAGTFNVEYESSYYTRLWLGVVAGYLFAELMPIDVEDFSKPLIAMLGGFAADAVESILKRLVDTLKTVVQGNMSDRIKALELSSKANLEAREIQLKLETARELTKTLDQLPDDATNSAARKLIEDFIRKKLT